MRNFHQSDQANGLMTGAQIPMYSNLNVAAGADRATGLTANLNNVDNATATA